MNIVYSLRCIPRWSHLPKGYGFHDEAYKHSLPHIQMMSLKEYEGTDVTNYNLRDRFVGTYDLVVETVEQCARYSKKKRSFIIHAY